jgi:hypothetical protein
MEVNYTKGRIESADSCDYGFQKRQLGFEAAK